MRDFETTLLIRGLRDYSSGRGDWRELVTNVILSKWPKPDCSPKTAEAEKGLEILDAPYYFYVNASHRPYHLVIFVHCEVRSSVGEDATSAGGCATPFDSGGLWHDYVRTKPTLDASGKKRFFQRNTYSSSHWPSKFSAYIHSNYKNGKEYIDGDVPEKGTPPIIRGSPNGSKAWTWEVRYPHQLAGQKLRLERLYMRNNLRDEYVKWLYAESSLEDGDAARIHRWLQKNLGEVNERISPLLALKDYLMSKLTNERSIS